MIRAPRAARLTQAQRRAVDCTTCGTHSGRPCKGSRVPSANTFGGGWGGPPDLEREHAGRVVAARERLARRLPLRASAVVGVPAGDTRAECPVCGIQRPVHAGKVATHGPGPETFRCPGSGVRS